MLEKYLQDIGFSDKEATVYLALLQVDSSSVLDLAKRTKIKRPTVYVILGSLAKKGLVTETTVGKKVHYHAESPERLATYIERQKVALDDQMRQLKDVIPQIKSIQREGGEKPTVQYFEGKEGVFMMHEIVHESDDRTDTGYVLYSRDLLDQVFPQEERGKFKAKRLAKGIKNKVLYTYTQGELASTDDSDRIKVDEKRYPFTCDISIFKDKVAISILGRKVSGIYIQSKDFAETLKSLFLIAFDSRKDK
jgi:sugar-specific transcriptional regulator TrmB